MLAIIADIVGWLATVFRASGMLMKSANMVKYLVSAGNALWMVNGIMTGNIPLVASNAICLGIMAVDIIKDKTKKSKKT